MAKKDKPAADKKHEKAKKAKKGKQGSAGDVTVSVAAHPRGRAQVRKAKGWGGLIGFAAAAYVSVQAHVPLIDVGMRALAVGIVGYLLAWGCAVTVWRKLVVAEMRVAIDQREAASAANAATAAKAVALAKSSPGPAARNGR